MGERSARKQETICEGLLKWAERACLIGLINRLAGTAFYVDCAAVRAATMGSVLVLDGIEKAERNVMPLLNNLLENREPIGTPLPYTSFASQSGDPLANRDLCRHS